MGLTSSLFICRDMTPYQQTPRRQLQVSEDLMGSGGELLAVPGTKIQGGSVVLASLRKEMLNFLSSKTCCSAYFGVSYDNRSVAKLQLILLCSGFPLSTGRQACCVCSFTINTTVTPTEKIGEIQKMPS